MNVIVIGAGIWGVCTAYYLQKAGARVTLVDMWGPGNARSGSGGHSRIIRLAYGSDRIYMDLTLASFALWEDIINDADAKLYKETGLLWMVSQEDTHYIDDARPYIENCGYTVDQLQKKEAKIRYPQINFDGFKKVYFENKAGILYADACCKYIVGLFTQEGGKYQSALAQVVEDRVTQNNFLKINNKHFEADHYVFACGPWTQKLFPSLLQNNSYVSRQEVYYFSVPERLTDLFGHNHLPIWFDYNIDTPLYYGMPFHSNMGLKISHDDRSVSFDPDLSDRDITKANLKKTRQYLYHRFPYLQDMPLKGHRICPYDNSRDGHFIVDTHPSNQKISILAGSSGHGFKMGPAIGNLVTQKIMNDKPYPTAFSVNRFDKMINTATQFKK